ncbi:TrmH family RNA methyltransferase [Leptospira idonii]|uniref:RNA methyltransferase n=1 Tax=Leptospira idonii TaxID=1193500 RepID=A0A4V3JY29_9LEPT|nr:RNA methyltransferase [Leptospira idonii]TGN19156.1 RNA methyltransferase [Leptospira idonii]
MQKTEKIRIFSENNEFQHADVLKRNRVKRSKHNKFFVEGVNAINLAIEYGWKIDSFLYSEESKLSNWAKEILNRSLAKKHIEMPASLLSKLSDKEESSELLALVEMKEDNINRIEIKKDLFVVVIDRASSPGNLGTIIRSCNAFGVDAILMTGHSVDLYDPKTIRASVGTLFATNVLRLGSHNDITQWLNTTKETLGEIRIIGTTVKTENTIDTFKFNSPLLLLIGNETYGLNQNYKSMCDSLVKIPIHGAASSLNVACATSIFLYEISKQIYRNSFIVPF